ncbi:MAG TPA: hypothetical protein VGA18_08535 [Rhodothermales bacterium]
MRLKERPCTFTMTIPTPDGAQEMHGRFTDLKAERDGKWLCVHDHASVPLPPASDRGRSLMIGDR